MSGRGRIGRAKDAKPMARGSLINWRSLNARSQNVKGHASGMASAGEFRGLSVPRTAMALVEAAALAIVAQYINSYCRRKIAALSCPIDLLHQLGNSSLSLASDALKANPEIVFDTDAGFVAANDD